MNSSQRADTQVSGRPLDATNASGGEREHQRPERERHEPRGLRTEIAADDRASRGRRRVRRDHGARRARPVRDRARRPPTTTGIASDQARRNARHGSDDGEQREAEPRRSRAIATEASRAPASAIAAPRLWAVSPTASASAAKNASARPHERSKRLGRREARRAPARAARRAPRRRSRS